MSTASVSVSQLCRGIGKVGVISPHLWSSTFVECRDAARAIERYGYGSLWTGERVHGKDAFVSATLLLSVTTEIMVGTGIASIWARSPQTAQGAAAGIAAAFPRRFINGLGVSHAFAAERRGQNFGRPVEQMRCYLESMDNVVRDSALDLGSEANVPVPRMLGAVGPMMLRLARCTTSGALPRLVTTEYVSQAREILGPNRILAPEQAFVLDCNPVEARRVGRAFVSYYLRLENYRKSLRTMGFKNEDLVDGGSDRLIDSLVAWGDERALSERMEQLKSAGADHILLNPLTRNIREMVSQLERLAPLILSPERVN